MVALTNALRLVGCVLEDPGFAALRNRYTSPKQSSAMPVIRIRSLTVGGFWIHWPGWRVMAMTSAARVIRTPVGIAICVRARKSRPSGEGAPERVGTKGAKRRSSSQKNGKNQAEGADRVKGIVAEGDQRRHKRFALGEHEELIEQRRKEKAQNRIDLQARSHCVSLTRRCYIRNGHIRTSREIRYVRRMNVSDAETTLSARQSIESLNDSIRATKDRISDSRF
jgi:hypothetical protein